MQKTIIIIGILILLVGLFWPLAKEIPLGRLPGDISVKGEKYSFYFPIVLVGTVKAQLDEIWSYDDSRCYYFPYCSA